MNIVEKTYIRLQLGRIPISSHQLAHNYIDGRLDIHESFEDQGIKKSFYQIINEDIVLQNELHKYALTRQQALIINNSESVLMRNIMIYKSTVIYNTVISIPVNTSTIQ